MNPNYSPTNMNVSPQKSKKLPAIIGLVSFIVAFAAVRIAIGIFTAGNIDTTQLAVDAKQQFNVPSKVDEYTTITDVTATKSAIRYHYTIAPDLDISSLSNAALKDNTKKSVCDTESTLNLLKKNINLEYAYQIENSQATYFFTISEADCSK